MNITENNLRKIIKEELKAILLERKFPKAVLHSSLGQIENREKLLAAAKRIAMWLTKYYGETVRRPYGHYKGIDLNEYGYKLEFHGNFGTGKYTEADPNIVYVTLSRRTNPLKRHPGVELDLNNNTWKFKGTTNTPAKPNSGRLDNKGFGLIAWYLMEQVALPFNY